MNHLQTAWVTTARLQTRCRMVTHMWLYAEILLIQAIHGMRGGRLLLMSHIKKASAKIRFENG